MTRTLTPKQKLVELIRTLDDAQQEWDNRSNGDGPLLMPSAYHEGSYPELEAALAKMRDSNGDRRRWWWHLNQRYRWGTLHHETVPCRHTRQGPIPRLRPRTELRTTGPVKGNRIQVTTYEWSAHVHDLYVDMALEHLLRTMHPGHPDRLRLPLTVLYRVLGMPPPTDRRP